MDGSKMYMDHNPDDPTVISRNFSDPFARLQDIRERIKDKYLQITVCAPNAEKYLYELYYDMVFLKNILVGVGLYSEKLPDHDVPGVRGIEEIVKKIRENLSNVDKPNSHN